MTKNRLESFSDGVIAIIITIMVLELKTPHDTTWEAIKPLFPVFISYVISFILLGIYWGNHHHLIHTLSHLNSKIIWANLHLLFWLSLIPFATAWMGENNFDKITVVVYAVLQTICSGAYFILLRLIMNTHHHDPELLIPLHKQAKKGRLSVIAYALAIPAAFINPLLGAVLFVVVTVFWWIPDKNIEKSMEEKG
jgi:uncharacterized membrane protein